LVAEAGRAKCEKHSANAEVNVQPAATARKIVLRADRAEIGIMTTLQARLTQIDVASLRRQQGDAPVARLMVTTADGSP
jgi:hypothetical protein